MVSKQHIYLSRQYRRLMLDRKVCILFLLGCVIPSVIVFLLFYIDLTYFIAVKLRDVLSVFVRDTGVSYGYFLPIFGGVYFVQMPTVMPSFTEVILNLAITLLLLCFCFFPTRGKKGGTPLTIYFALILLIHLVSVIYFLFAMDYFPYSAATFSELYIKQQVGIWLCFLILSGLITGILGYGNISGRILAFLGIMAYSLLFGTVRYLIFMFIISKASSLYMATLFFSLGPLFDFLYLVCLYSIYVNAQINYFNRGEGRLKWHWL